MSISNEAKKRIQYQGNKNNKNNKKYSIWKNILCILGGGIVATAILLPLLLLNYCAAPFTPLISITGNNNIQIEQYKSTSIEYGYAVSDGTTDPGNVKFEYSGDLPTGLSFDATNNILSGTPTNVGLGSFIIQVYSDKLGSSQPYSVNWNVLEISPAIIDNYLDLSQPYFVSSYYVGNELIYCPTDTKMLDLKTYAETIEYFGSLFVIDGTIKYGILINPDQAVDLVGENDATIELGTKESQLNDNNAVGIAIGQTSGTGGMTYTNALYIDNSVNVDIYTTSSLTAYGVCLYSIDTFAQIFIGAAFNVFATGEAYGVNILAGAPTLSVNGFVTINGVFIISSSVGIAMGVYIPNCSTTSKIVINGVFSVYGFLDAYGFYSEAANYNTVFDGVFNVKSDRKAYGIYLKDIAVNVTINGAYTVLGNDETYGITFFKGCQSSTINGAFTVSSTTSDACAIYFFSDFESTGSLTIDGIFAVVSSGDAYGINFYYGNPSETITLGGHFFSNKAATPSDYWPNNYVADSPSWNGTVFSGNFESTSEDGVLQAVEVKDDDNTPHYQVSVIWTTNETNKNEFNNNYANVLSSYTASGHCPNTSKSWLDAISWRISHYDH